MKPDSQQCSSRLQRFPLRTQDGHRSHLGVDYGDIEGKSHFLVYTIPHQLDHLSTYRTTLGRDRRPGGDGHSGASTIAVICFIPFKLPSLLLCFIVCLPPPRHDGTLHILPLTIFRILPTELNTTTAMTVSMNQILFHECHGCPVRRDQDLRTYSAHLLPKYVYLLGV